MCAPGLSYDHRAGSGGKRAFLAAYLPLALVILAVGSTHGAGQGDLQEIIDAQHEIRSLQASFSQTKLLSLFDDRIESSGTIVIEKPDFYRWAYESPERRVFYVDGTKTGTLEPETGEREEVELQSKIGLATVIQSVTSIITGNLQDTTELDYEITKNKSPSGLRSFTFRPRTEELQTLFERITIRFDGRTKLARDLEIEEPNGDITRMEFDNWRINIPVDRANASR